MGVSRFGFITAETSATEWLMLMTGQHDQYDDEPKIVWIKTMSQRMACSCSQTVRLPTFISASRRIRKRNFMISCIAAIAQRTRAAVFATAFIFKAQYTRTSASRPEDERRKAASRPEDEPLTMLDSFGPVKDGAVDLSWICICRHDHSFSTSILVAEGDKDIPNLCF